MHLGSDHPLTRARLVRSAGRVSSGGLALLLSACFGGRVELGFDTAGSPGRESAGGGCACGASPGPSEGLEATQASSELSLQALPPRRASRVLVITLDGLGSRPLAPLLEEGALPTFRRLRELGGSTLEARTDFEVTVTLPNHTSVLTGRPVTAVPGLPADTHHGYTANAVPAATETLHSAGNPALDYIASMYDVAHDRGYNTCLFASKQKFVLFAQSYDAANGAPDTVGKDDGTAKIDQFFLSEDRSLIEVAAAELSAGRCDLSLLHVTDLDTPLGHSTGWGSEAWRQGLVEIDGELGALLDRLESSGGLDDWGIVLTADHGGEGFAHADATNPAVYEIPFLVVGPTIPGGAELYSLLAGRRVDPGDERPAYDAPEQPVRNGDAANLALELLGLPPVPGSLLRDLRLGG